MRFKGVAASVAALTMIAAACGSDAKQSDSTTAVAPPTTAAAAAATTAAPAPAEAGDTIRLWLNGGDTPDDFVTYATTEFNKLHPDVKVVFERQQWTGIVEKLTTALSSSDSPDVVELGNTQAQAFEAAGALEDLTAKKADLGGDDLLQSLVEAGTYNDKFFGVPYYAGARVMLYRKDLFEKSGIAIPTTMDEMLAAGEKLKADNADIPNFSGIYLPGKNWFAALPFLWANGGDIALKSGDKWTGDLSSPESLKGLTELQQFIQQTSAAPVDGDDSKDYLAFCNGEVGMMPAPGWKQFAAQGTIPALKSLLPTISGSESAVAQAKAAENSRFVPSSPNWAAVEATSILPDMIVAISGGADVKTEAAKADAAIEGILNG
jgi:N,N'-diacetylchitobiose transport system substrate-binding protein